VVRSSENGFLQLCPKSNHMRACFYGGYMDDWRLPTLAELYGLTHGDEAVLSGTPRAFSGVQSSYYYWSSTTYADDTYLAWSVYLGDGSLGIDAKDEDDYVWPVRGGQ